MIATVTLILGAFLLNHRFTLIISSFGLVSHAIGPFLLAFFIQVCIMALGGPTGFSVNPARDLGPRFAHWILPIHGKGSSEWKYSITINIGILIGGIISGGLYLALLPLSNIST